MKQLAALLLAVATPVAAAERSFTIASEPFTQDEIVDARAAPDLSGGATIRLTFSESGSARLFAITKQRLNREVPIVLDGKTLMSPVVREPIEGGTVLISAPMTLLEADALARAISGKDPLPESLDE